MKALLFVIVLAFGVASTAAAQSAEDLFQQALRVERVSGNTEAAIELYGQIVADYPMERFVVARALLQMGKAYEVLGVEGAREAYSLIVRDYSDFAAVAREAAERVAAFQAQVDRARSDAPSARPEPMSRTRVGIDGISSWGSSLSPTGRFLVGASEGNTNGLVILELATGERTFIPGAEGFGVFGNVRFSPDESRLAYSGSPKDSKSTDLFVVDIQSGQSSMVLDGSAEFDECSFASVGDWSRDGSMLVAHVNWREECAVGGDTQWAILLFPLDGNPPARLTVERGETFYASGCLSADGRYAFATIEKDETYLVRRFDTQTEEEALWRDDAWIAGCMWEPDRILYATEGIPGDIIRSASPEKLEADADDLVIQLESEDWFTPASNSKVGDLPIFSGGQVQRFVVAGYESESGTIRRAKELDFEGAVQWLTWSPSGKRLAWMPFGGGLTIWDPQDGGRDVVKSEELTLFQGWVTDKTLWGWVPNRAAKEDDQRAHTITFDLAERKILSRLEAAVADSLGFTITDARPLDEDSWAVWMKDRNCIIRIVTETQEQSDLKCFEAGTYPWVGLFPSPWEATTLTLGVRPDSTSVLGLLADDGSSYREIRVDRNRTFVQCMPASCNPFNGRQVRWVSPNEAMYGTYGPDGWVSTLLIDLTTGETTEVLRDLREQFNPWLVAISPSGEHVAAYGLAADVDGETVMSIIHNMFGDR